MKKISIKTICLLLLDTSLLFSCKLKDSEAAINQNNSTTIDSFFNSYIQQDKGQKFSKNILLLNKSGSKLSITDVTYKTPKLVLRFSNYNCWHCVKECLIALRKLVKDSVLYKKDILLVGSDYGLRGFRLLCRDKVPDFNVYRINKNIGLTLEKLNTPFFFVIDSNSIITQLWVPVEGKIKNTEKYLSQIAVNKLK